MAWQSHRPLSWAKDDARFCCSARIWTVPNAGKYDGVLGVLLAVAAVRLWVANGFLLPWTCWPFPKRRDSISDGLLGQPGSLRTFDMRLLERTDAAGVTMGEALPLRTRSRRSRRPRTRKPGAGLRGSSSNRGRSSKAAICPWAWWTRSSAKVGFGSNSRARPVMRERCRWSYGRMR